MIDLPVCYAGKMKKPNPKTLAEDVRRFGLILAAAGVVAGVLEDTNVSLSAGLAAAGGAPVWLGNLEEEEDEYGFIKRGRRHFCNRTVIRMAGSPPNPAQPSGQSRQLTRNPNLHKTGFNPEVTGAP